MIEWNQLWIDEMDDKMMNSEINDGLINQAMWN